MEKAAGVARSPGLLVLWASQRTDPVQPAWRARLVKQDRSELEAMKVVTCLFAFAGTTAQHAEWHTKGGMVGDDAAALAVHLLELFEIEPQGLPIFWSNPAQNMIRSRIVGWRRRWRPRDAVDEKSAV